jgi:HEAT repeat protein
MGLCCVFAGIGSMIGRCSALLPALLLVSWLIISNPCHAADEAGEADARLLREAHVSADDTSLLEFFKKRTLTNADRVELQRLIRLLGSESFEERERASHTLLSRGPLALRFLQEALRDPDPEIVRRADRCISEIEQGPGASLPAAAARTLARRHPPEAMAALLEYVPFADDDTVEEEVLGALVSLAAQQEKNEAVLARALHDALTARRGAAAYVLGRSKDERDRAAVRPALKDTSAKVRFRAAQALIAAHEKEAVAALVDLLPSAPDDLAWQAEEILFRLAGEQAPQISSGDGSAPARQKQRDAWAAWWREHANTTDLARLEQEEPYLGLTVIAQMNTGKVWEIGRDGKPRWTLDKLQGPIDAQVLRGERVLVAEYQGSRVTERDFQGHVLWEKTLTSNPLVCQRMPNGNTFIATYDKVLEVTRDGREVYSHHPRGGAGVARIYGAQKLRNGHIVTVTLDGSVHEMDAATGKDVKSFTIGVPGCYGIEGLPSGRYLVANYNQGQVLELSPEGKILWECKVAGAYHATRLANGNTLVSSHSGQRVVEVNREGQTVWEQPAGNNVWRVHRR